MKSEKIRNYEKNWKQYDEWHETHKAIYQSEIKALEKIMPTGQGLEIGVGTGRFATPFSIQYGIDPALNMLKLAKQRNIQVVQGKGENLPFKKESFHFISIVLTLWLVDDPLRVINEAIRTLKKKGSLIPGIIDRNSAWGRFYERRADHGKFYKSARFFSTEETLQILKNLSEN